MKSQLRVCYTSGSSRAVILNITASFRLTLFVEQECHENID